MENVGIERTLGTLVDALNIRKEGDDMCSVSLKFPAYWHSQRKWRSQEERELICVGALCLVVDKLYLQ